MISLARALCTLTLMCILFFVLVFPYRRQLRFSYRVTLFFALSLCLVYMLPYCFVNFNVHTMGVMRIINSCIGVFLLSAVLSYLTKSSFSIMIFSMFFIRNLTDSLMMAARFIHIFLIPQLPMSDYVTLLLYILFCLATAPWLLHFIEWDIKPNAIYISSKTRKLLWMIPFTLYLFFRIFADADYMQEVIIWAPRSIILPFVWFFGTMICHYVILMMIRETAQTTELKEQLKYSELMTKVQRREYTSLESNINATRKIKHDMRHHLIALDGYLKSSDIPAARNYLSSLLSSVDYVQLKPYCLNYAVNSLLNYYAEKAIQHDIKVTLSVNLCERLPIADTDFCTILGNLFENALEACLRPNVSNPFITLNIGYAGSNMLVLSVRNSYAGTIRVSDGSFLSSKRNEAGIGTASVKYMVEKHNGICRFLYHDNIFEVSILLNPDDLSGDMPATPLG